MPTGPRGEKRPVSPVSSMVKAMRVATGIEKEEYVDGKPRVPVGSSSEDELEDDLPIAARRIANTKKEKNETGTKT